MAGKHVKSLCLARFDALSTHVAWGAALGCYQPLVHGSRFTVRSPANRRPRGYHVLESVEQ